MERKVNALLVTGGCGFIGSAFIRYLLSRTSFVGKCVNLDALTYAGNIENVNLVSQDPRYVFVHGNICDQRLVERLIQEYAIDTILHFAAESHVDRSIDAPSAFIETNIVGTFRLLEAVRNFPHIHFHHVSTDEVYGMLGDEGFFTEESPYQPSSPYSASKAASDHLVRAYAHTYNLSVTLSNCSNNYGPYHYPEKLIPLTILNCLDHKPIPVYGKGWQVRDWLYVDDHAVALDLILKRGRRGETYNIGGESERRNIDVVTQIVQLVAELKGERLSDLMSLITFVTDRKGHDYRYAIDCSKIKKELGWAQSHTFETGLRETVAWFIAYHNANSGPELKPNFRP